MSRDNNLLIFNFIFPFEHISLLFLVFLSLALNKNILAGLISLTSDDSYFTTFSAASSHIERCLRLLINFSSTLVWFREDDSPDDPWSLPIVPSVRLLNVSRLRYFRQVQRHVRGYLSSADTSIFHQKLTTFVISEKKDKICILVHNLWFFWL